MEQLAIACPNLYALCLQKCFHCLESLQGLQAIASHCRNLQILDLLGVHVSKVEDHIIMWEILSNMKLTELKVESCLLKPKCASKKMLIGLYKKCWSITKMNVFYACHCHQSFFNRGQGALMLSYFPSLNCCQAELTSSLPTIVQDFTNNCKELRVIHVRQYEQPLSLCATYNQNLEQLYIYSPQTDVSDDFITSVSAHGGLVRVFMKVKSLTVEGITSLVRNSPKLTALFLLQVSAIDVSVEDFNTILKKLFQKRKLFTKGFFKYTNVLERT